MMAGSGEGADVQAELHTLRRRLNGLTAQQTVALAVTAVALCASLLLAVALRAAPVWFTIASWSAAALLLGLAAYLPWRAYRAWLSIDDAAYLADRNSGLDGRLSTLLADPDPKSRLRPILVEQVRIARPRWQADRLAPRRVAPTLLLVPASLMILAIVAFLARPAARPSAAFQPWQTRAAKLGGAAPPDAQIALAETGASETGAGSAAGDAHGSAQSGGRGQESGEGAHGQASDANAGDQSGDAGDASDRLRDAIREAMGAESDSDSAHVGRGKHGTADGDPNSPNDAGKRSETDGPTADSRSSNAQPADAPPDGQSQPDPNRAAKGSDAPGGDGTKGAGPGGSTGTLFAEAPQAGADGGAEAKPMPIKLGAFAAAAQQHGEPQRRDGPISQAVMTSAGRGPAADLALAQAPDAALQKLDLAPEHESIVRRIFTRE